MYIYIQDATLPVPRLSTAMGAPTSKNPSTWLHNPQVFICHVFIYTHVY